MQLSNAQQRALKEVGYFYHYVEDRLERIDKNNLWLIKKNAK